MHILASRSVATLIPFGVWTSYDLTQLLLISPLVPWDACGTPTVKIQFGCTQNCKASQYDCVKSLSIISSSKPTNHIVQNLYRFLIDLLPLKNAEIRTFLAK